MAERQTSPTTSTIARGTLFLDDGSRATSGLDSALGGSREGVSLDVESLGKFATAEDFHSVVRGNETILAEGFEVEIHNILGFGKRSEGVDVDADILNAVAVFEAEFGEATIDGHLTTFETDFLMITGTGLGTLVTTGGGTALAGASTTANAFGVLNRALCGFEII